MHSFAINVKGGESRRIFPSITKGEIVGHRLSLMSIWQYSRGGERAIEGENGAKRRKPSQRNRNGDERSTQSHRRSNGCV